MIVPSIYFWPILVSEILWVCDRVGEPVPPAPRPDRIAAEIPPERRVVVAHVVLEVVRGGIGPLAGETQGILNRARDGVGAAVGGELAVPHYCLRGVGDLLDALQVVGMHAVERG